MFLELIAVFVAGFAGAGVMMLLTRVAGGRLPRWTVPAGAGLAMLAAAISSEYGWYTRTHDALPEGFAVAGTHESRALWRPWTYAVPMTDRFIAIDGANLRANEQTEGLYMAEVYFFARWQPVQSVEMMVDCKGHRRADPGTGDGGDPVWREVGADDPIVSTVCAEVPA
ncbi:hypothetical protein [Salipiger mucosus]|uniref:Uncharacterized protein n=1 Tax=Salipiger mucosus DSM 16094 TaxID=1123237 RepID=S9SFJ9_9RHOB|nr:hypothetical protein [Salipiger mucosus]EPX85044.1 Hypothetical protein in cluster with DNA polymerase III epsilon subunit [Salipiger mucosus DSM 16094]